MDQNYRKYIDEIFNNYNAYYQRNRGKDLNHNTHKNQFAYLIELFKSNDKIMKKLIWILRNYDYHWKNEYGDKYIGDLQKKIEEEVENEKKKTE